MMKLTYILLTLLFCLVSPCWAAFPQNSSLFSCTGTDNTSPPSASWTTVGYPQLKILTNKCVGSSSGANADYWNPTTFNADQEVFANLATKASTTGDYIDLILRFDSASVNGYVVRYGEDTGATDAINIYRMTGGSYTQLATFAQEFVTGKVWGMKAVGNILTVYYDGNAVGTYDITSDGTKYTGTGKTGVVIGYTTTSAAFTNFGAGNYTASTRRRVLVTQ